MGRRVDLATVDDKPVAVAAPAEAAVGVLLELVVANPRNPRESVGDLSDLQSIAKRQLQPCLVVSAKGYLALWPEDAEKVGDARYVVVNGCRRLAAAHKYGRSDLLIVHDETVAETRGDLLGAAVDENIGRRDFDIIEEARAVDAVVAEYPSTREAAKARGWTHGWISQRRALLKLSPEMQEALRAGDLAVRDARRLARVPAEQQVATWRAEQEAAEQRKKEEAERRKQKPTQQQQPPATPAPAPPAEPVVVTTTEAGTDPESGAPAEPPVVTAVTTEGREGDLGSGIPQPRHDPAPASSAITVEWTDPQAVADLCTQNMTRDDLEAMLDILTSRL